ncbi:hypothetical protein N865_13345 [Intrasporangium oryzae NRRL B-24470]|uniref:Uncharacterized protein n=1 Tax=Intrasporangium oryzae NRRL B-24470 TaxID=1386089 RepID=W9GAA9_9MICO|nr:hypothetical protein [Intrasporangium oryzae]EWT00814.1 hypothetical protein N865_13345 [Intrasporangium oryzae NRRL B-24470]
MTTGARLPGDPGSVSALGGALRSQALRLADLVDELESATARASRMAGSAPNGEGAHADPSDHERDLLTLAATELDRIGGLLQAWTAGSVEDGARLRSLADDAERAGLRVEGHLVVEPPGPSRADPAERLRAREHLQELLNRVTAGRARELARLGRELDASQAALARVSDRARAGRRA